MTKNQSRLASLCLATLVFAACGGGGAGPSATGAAGASAMGAAGTTATGTAGTASSTGAAGSSMGAAGTMPTGAAGKSGAAGTTGTAGKPGGAGTTGAAGTTSAAGTTGSAGTAANPTGAGGSLGAFPGLDVGPVSDGATLTFQMIGAAGMYPSRRDPASGPCDVEKNGTCCLTNQVETGTSLSPWNEELSATWRGPMLVKQFAVYQPPANQSGAWSLTSSWDARTPTAGQNVAFSGPPTAGATGFAGVVGNKCLVDVSTAKEFACGPGSVPYCPTPPSGQHKYWGWAGSKLYIMLASFPHYGAGGITAAQNCNNATTDNWYDAPWIGISHGELVRQGLYNGCQCYSYPDNPNAGNGCGQLNAFEIVNDNNTYRNFDVFSTNFFGYGGYVGEGPCGTGCNVTNLPAAVDLVSKKNGGNMEAPTGAISTPKQGPGAAFRRPATGYRYVMALFDVTSRTVQLAFIHPGAVPPALAAMLPSLPQQVPQATIDGLVQLRLPH